MNYTYKIYSYCETIIVSTENLLDLVFITETYKAHFITNEYLLNQKQSKSCFVGLHGTLVFENNTRVTNQHNFLVSTGSVISIRDSEISSISITYRVLVIIRSELDLYNVTFSNITTPVGMEILRFTSGAIVT